MARSTRSNPTTDAPASTAAGDSSTVPMALFMPLAAPQLKSTSHAALVQWRKLRSEYEDEVAMRCNNDPTKMAEVIVSVKKSFDKRLLTAWCDFEWDVDVNNVTDDFILAKIDDIIASVKNNAVPDVAALFKENVVMDMRESDVKERVMQFFVRSREFIDEQGWQAFFTGNEGVRLKCKLLIEALEPRSLREEVSAVVKYQARIAKEDEKELFKLILEKALDQDRDFQRRKRSRGRDPGESKRKEKQTQSSTNQPPAKYRKVEHGGKSTKKDSKASNNQVQKKSAVKRDKTPPTGGCLKCKGDHWLVHCPTASSDEKKDLLRKMHERRDNKRANDNA
ncbi:hypothetical protein PPTG_20422 [Phytophthora nicotianae INRA-310]|uniref:Uncharacterized protein n=1 Tax=Phytophthora nicotianae (strain INRA-310) TaxID=761204 RepID=W2PAG2_PHYN3|nr:hypothetical protein PPTG_20422 [Phytophthora nicotianae INRA-310]ETM97228.1 hypothetical protein PPTG_20422 [Phytophthora nicotianae INRA-310]